MRVVALVLASFILTACIPRTPQIAVKPRMNELVDDGSKAMKVCKFECQKEKTQCEIKNNTADSFNSGRAVYYDQFSMAIHGLSKELETQTCQVEFENCFKEICGGKVMVKQ